MKILSIIEKYGGERLSETEFLFPNVKLASKAKMALDALNSKTNEFTQMQDSIYIKTKEGQNARCPS